MLAIRMQRTGRKGHAQFRVIVQDSRRTPTSGKIVAAVGHYNPHTKAAVLEKEKVDFYLEHGAKPSDRVARLLKNEGIKLPTWVKLEPKKSRTVRNPDKFNKSAPKEQAAPEETDQPATEESAELPTQEPEAVETKEEAEEVPANEEGPKETDEKPSEPANEEPKAT